ncbi:hypothetical protein [Deinococcus misasensis]|uniref:hypothetical protein n=1 Tax=Deinococcus misasensis TaxID=392413 RepID=UPI00054D37FF|nr:hypothetical protein [Deinococcus misasensis]
MPKIAHLLPLALLMLSGAQALELPNTNCSTDKSNMRCKWFSSSQDAGSIGEGPTFAQGGLDRVTSGFIEPKTNTLYVSVELGGQMDRFGAILAVDLKTGNRTLISGMFSDGEKKGKSIKYTTSGGTETEAYHLGFVRNIRPLPNGNIAAWVPGFGGRAELQEVNVQTGDRTLLWASRGADDTHKGGLRDIEGGPEGPLSRTTCPSLNPKEGIRVNPSLSFETDGKGNFYVLADNNPAGTGLGLLKIVPHQGCSWVSGYFSDGTSVKGDGPMILAQNPIMLETAYANGKMYGVTGPNPDGNALFSYDPVTGDRSILSLKARVKARNKGSGDAEVGYLGGFALGKTGFLTVGQGPANDWRYFIPTFVDAATGNRTLLEAASGPLKSNIRDSDQQVLASIPDTNQFVIYMSGALYVFDADTRNSYTLSF